MRENELIKVILTYKPSSPLSSVESVKEGRWWSLGIPSLEYASSWTTRSSIFKSCK